MKSSLVHFVRSVAFTQCKHPSHQLVWNKSFINTSTFSIPFSQYHTPHFTTTSHSNDTLPLSLFTSYRFYTTTTTDTTTTTTTTSNKVEPLTESTTPTTTTATTSTSTTNNTDSPSPSFTPFPLTYESIQSKALALLTYTEHYTLKKFLNHPKKGDPSLFLSSYDAHGYYCSPWFSNREQSLLRKCALILDLSPKLFGLPDVLPRKPLRTKLPKGTKHERSKPMKLKRLQDALENMDHVLFQWKQQKIQEKEKRRSTLPF